jgi:hypothetical protein
MLALLRARGYSVGDCGNDYFALDRKALSGCGGERERAPETPPANGA